jgi:hypothetical protein
MKKMIFIVWLIFILGCNQNKNSEDSSNNSSEHVSTHQQELLKYSAINNFNFNIIEDKILVDTTIGKFANPNFSTDGTKLFFTSENYNEIWVYNFKEGTLNKIVSLPQCGYNYQITDDGSDIYFRNKVTDGKKSYSILNYSLSTKKIEVIYTSEKRISPPLLINKQLYILDDGIPQNINLVNNLITGNFSSSFLFVEDNKLAKCNSTKMDTIKLPSNIIPVSCNYSKDRENIFVQTNIGILICDKNGIPINIINGANFASKLFKSNLLVFTKEVDEHNKILSSKMFIGFLNNDKIFEILQNDNSKKYYPDWSPTDNKIAYISENGSINILSFNIGNN